VKSFLRELPEPICTFECYDMFLSVTRNPDENERKLILKKVLTFLTKTNRKSKIQNLNNSSIVTFVFDSS
jgi:hypothetical protein